MPTGAKQKVRTAVILVAGMGTRFLPATKNQPKEMLPIVDKPVVQYLVEEAVASGITDIVFVTNRDKTAVRAHFSPNKKLERFLEARGKPELTQKILSLHKQARFHYTYQDNPRGNGDAVSRAKKLVGTEPFALFFADDIMISEREPAIKQLISAHNLLGTSIMGLVRVPRKEVYRYGVVKSKKVGERIYSVKDVVEKPHPDKAPSNFASVGRFVLTNDVFERIKQAKPRNGEIYLADALAALAREGQVHGVEMDGTWYDCGSKIGFWRANFEFGLAHDEIGQEARGYLHNFRNKTK
ncbi:MAG: hypothetical protein A2932_00035 [Candidatus Spechtbacteria bacterium RIFCSPLOWO2_01_FULL_46_10]|uniref:UTP--glucose-1-phosphate uridylyltransferase n=1 Tax=Candidatus Spechtbacteria bacterium RIFCSPLOWO2_01_FULL_46_10 TaxID=1802163 RepID=A0A1G2HFQ3_9BACT|nr:MAG: hypothetical protein A2932_00035 [Candidatus Spechtbacteria bacterium RIFCSPLOWO2_01_FULL_46_10]